MQSPPLIQSANVPSSSKSDHRYQSSLIVDYPLLAQRGQVSGQPPIAHVQQYERACPVPTTTLNQPSGVDAVYYRDYPLLAQRGQVSWQPPIAHVQPYRRACAVPTAALEQPLGVNAVCYRPTVDVPVVAQYHASATFSPKNTSLVHTHASFSNQPISEFISKNCGNWTLALDVPIPEDLVHPTLTSLSYTVKYSTANDHLACVVRSNILLATTESEELSDKKTSEATAVCLSSVLGIKPNDLENQWNHFVDRQEIPVNARIVENSRLYLQIHISEYPTVAMLRSLSMDVFATWLDEDEEKRLLQKKQKAEELARTEAEAKKVAEAKEEREKQVGSAADEKMQEKIQKALDRLPKERKCPQGYAWVQNPTGFKCAAGGHSISWEELNQLTGSGN